MDINTIIIITGGVIAGLFVLGLIISITGKDTSAEWKKDVISKVNKISSSTDTNNRQSLKLSIMEYDKVLDFVLIKMNAKGNTLGERLKQSKNLFPDNATYQKTWDLHKLRNRIAHEFDAEFNQSELASRNIEFRKLLNRLASR